MQGEIEYLVEYPPFRALGQDNPNKTKWTYKLMDLKNPSAPGHNAAVNELSQLLEEKIRHLLNSKEPIQIAIAPSSQKGQTSVGVEKIVKKIAEKFKNITYNKNYLTRTRTIEKLHEGGSRDIRIQIDTIKCIEKPNKNIKTIIIDDITATGNSLLACKAILSNEGCRDITLLAIGKTVWP